MNCARVHCAVTDTTHQPHTSVGWPNNCIHQSQHATRGMPLLGVSVVDGGGETPGPIPNPEAKPARADGTAPGREWESRLPPTQQLHTQAPADTQHRASGCFHIYAHTQGSVFRIADNHTRTNHGGHQPIIHGEQWTIVPAATSCGFSHCGIPALRTTKPAPIIGPHQPTTHVDHGVDRPGGERCGLTRCGIPATRTTTPRTTMGYTYQRPTSTTGLIAPVVTVADSTLRTTTPPPTMGHTNQLSESNRQF